MEAEWGCGGGAPACVAVLLATVYDAAMPQDERPEGPLAELLEIQKHRRIAVGAALGLLILSLFWAWPYLGAVRAACWAMAGVMSLRETAKAKQVGIRGPGYGSAMLYFAVALLPFLRGV